MRAVADGVAVETVIKQQKTAKYTKRIFATLRERLKSSHSKGITNIMVPDPTEEDPDFHKTVYDPVEIESLLITRNINHFGQAQGSPFTIPPLSKKLGYEGTNEFAARIINGEQILGDIRGMDRGVQQFLGVLNDRTRTPSFPIDITFEEFMKGFRKWSEDTSTSPSGRHLGHYKVLLRAEYKSSTKPGEEIRQDILQDRNQMGKQIFRAIYHISLAAVLAGESLTRWIKVKSSMIKKVPGKPLLSKLRVIHLYEADYNLLLKLLWTRRLSWQAHLKEKEKERINI